MSAINALVLAIDDSNFEAEVLQSARPVLVAFWAPWSRPCQILRSVVEEVAAACAGWIKVVQVDADDHPDLGLWYGIQSIPTLVCFVNGKERVRIVGTASKEAILLKLKPFVAA